MINLMFTDKDGAELAIEYDVHPRSQNKAILIPPTAVSVVVWLGTL